MLLTSRDEILRDAPKWLRGPVGEKLLYSFGVVQDAITEMLLQSVRARFPTRGALDTTDALRYLGRDRRLPQYPDESDEDYADRLVPWIDTHKGRGGSIALLEQLRVRYAAAPFPIELIRPESGKRYTLPTDGSPITVDTVDPAPSPTDHWCTWLLAFHWPVPLAHKTWGGPWAWGDGTIWGFDVPTSFTEELLQVPADWNAAHPIGYLAILDDTNAATFWDFPSGSWTDGVWDVGGVKPLVLRVPSPTVLV
jgi:hypothetical protein